jgi:ribosome biogenesis SPOUT family RNA methylase Rps3|tara:strand:+ start:256 stop:447 length:192 start_codon:yes stop_codon:yes gene_type:complete
LQVVVEELVIVVVRLEDQAVVELVVFQVEQTVQITLVVAVVVVGMHLVEPEVLELLLLEDQVL